MKFCKLLKINEKIFGSWIAIDRLPPILRLAVIIYNGDFLGGGDNCMNAEERLLAALGIAPEPKIRLLICGDRNWTEIGLIVAALAQIKDSVECVIHGAARGADTLGGVAASDLGIRVIRFPANWAMYGRAAGPIRNQQMLDEGKPTRVWAFHPDIENSRGTKDMVQRARKAGIPVEIFA